MTEVHQGIVLGTDIRLTQPSGFAVGQSVEVTIRSANTQLLPVPGSVPFDDVARERYEAVIQASDGAWADDPEDLESMLAELRSWRENDRPPLEP